MMAKAFNIFVWLVVTIISLYVFVLIVSWGTHPKDWYDVANIIRGSLAYTLLYLALCIALFSAIIKIITHHRR